MKIELLKSRDRHGNNLYKLLECYIHWEGTVVPKGFVTNFGTIPKGLRWFIRPSELREAAVVHDYRVGEFDQRSIKIPRKKADSLLAGDLARIGISWYKVTAIWVALRVYATLARKK